MNKYTLGNSLRLTAVFKNISRQEVDPSAVVVKVKVGLGSLRTIATTKDGSGRYHTDLILDSVGIWSYRWEATGAVITAAERTFSVTTIMPS